MNVIVLDLELVRADLGPGKLVQARILHVDDAPTAKADKVVMLTNSGVEAGGGARVAGLGHQAEGHESAENAVDRHARDLGKLITDGAVDLLGGGVVGALDDHLEDGLALDGDGQAAFAVDGEEAVHALFLVSRAHDLLVTYMHQMVMICK